MSDIAYPTNKDELIEFIEDGRDELMALINSVSDEELTRPGEEGWSIKDHLAHLVSWEAGIVALLNRQPRWESMGLTREIVEQNDDTSLNNLVRERVSRLSVQEVKDWFADVHRAMLDVLDRLSWEDLNRSYAYFETGDDDPSDQRPVGGWVVGNTYGHYAEHLQWMRRLLETQRSR